MTIVHKVVAEKGDGQKVVEKAAHGGNFQFILSDETPDSYGDIIMAKGWDLSRFEAGNPVALWDHGKDPEIGRKPIGRWKNVRVSGKQLIGTLEPARGVSPRIDEIIKLHELGFLPAVSVGFIPIESEPIDPRRPYDGTRYIKQQITETSLVAVPANPAALQLAKSHQISNETIALAFGEHAETRRRDVTATGKHADTTTEERRTTGSSISPKVTSMKTVSQRLEEAQVKLAAKHQRQTEILSADELDAAALDVVIGEIATLEKDVEVLKRAEAAMAKGAGAAGAAGAPAINRRPLGFPQKDVKPLDLLIRKAVVKSVSIFADKPVEKVLDERYPGHEATDVFVKADPGVASTGGSHYVDDLQQISYQGFIEALDGKSVFPALRSAGLALSLDSAGTAYVPGVAAGGANGSFFAEGSPIRVGKVTTDNRQLTSRKIGVIIAFTREAAKRSTPDLEALFRRRILADTAAVIDSALLDNVAQDSVRPGGVLYDPVASAAIAATATGYGGGDHTAVMEDFKALIQPFIDANAADGITVVMNPKQGLSMDFMVGPDGALGDWFARARARFSFLESTHATAGRLIAVRAEDFASAVGGVDFVKSNQATLHMEDASPAALVTGGGPTVASPQRSLYQTDSEAIRMVMDINWRMMRQGMVRWIDTTSW